MNTPGLFEFAMLATMRPSERQRATPSLVISMLPGPPVQRSALTAVAVTTQVKDGLRRERRVAGEVVEAVKLAAQDPAAFTTDKLRALPGLRTVATDTLRDSILSLTAPAGAAKAGASAGAAAKPVTAADPRLEQAVAVAAFVAEKGRKLTLKEAEKYPDFLLPLAHEQWVQIVG